MKFTPSSYTRGRAIVITPECTFTGQVVDVIINNA